MYDLHLLQKVTLIIFTVGSLLIFFYSWWKRKKISFGTLETTLVPLAVVLFCVFILDFQFVQLTPLLIVGLVLYIVGSAFNLVAFMNLGWVNSDDFWFARRDDKPRYMAQVGPYKYFRHPVFMSIAVSSLGLVLVFLHPVTIVLWLVAMVFGVVTSFREEQFMQEQFPEYSNYMEATGRFFPKLRNKPE